MSKAASAPKKLKSLTPLEFENLIFDLMIARGMRNVAWRTPGADGGRDIEGEIIHSDFSLTKSTSQWFVECKKYKGSVDWPTIYGKIAYADSEGADVLLMCTTSKFTPTAISQANNWNSNGRYPTVRLWPGHQLENLLGQHQDIAMKYGLSATPEVPTGSTLQLMLALSKSVASSHSKIIFNDEPLDPMLEAANSLAQLLQKRMEDVDRENRFRPNHFHSDKFKLKECTISTGNYNVDELALAAFTSYLYAVNRKEIDIYNDKNGICTLRSASELAIPLSRYKKTFDAISLWGDFEYELSNDEIKIRSRS